MLPFKLILPALALLICVPCINLLAQHPDRRIQYPPGLKNAYFGLNVGYINYPFSPSHLEKNFSAESIEVPHTAVRFILYGRQFNKYLSAQISYMRPVTFARYNNVNGDQKSHNVWMTVGGVTLNLNLPVKKRFSLSTEAGLGVVTRKGFSVNEMPAMLNASYATFLFGGSFNYHLNRKWELRLSTVWSPAHAKVKQPQTLFYSFGFNYHLVPLSSERVERNIKTGSRFPRQVIFAGITSNALGYGVNNAVSKGPVPIFWGGDALVKKGISIHYQRNIFHARKVFSLDWGAGAATWKSRDKNEKFFTFSLYPVLKFMVMRSKPLDLGFEYGVAGPTFISRILIDDKKTGKNFTFYDFMGMHVYAGKNKNLHAGLRIAHFSNGNLFTNNQGVMVPLTLNLGYVLK